MKFKGNKIVLLWINAAFYNNTKKARKNSYFILEQMDVVDSHLSLLHEFIVKSSLDLGSLQD